MLNKFSVKGFKNFKEECVLDLSNRNMNTYLIYGKNASGKTNLGYALFDIVTVLTGKYYNPDKYRYSLHLNGNQKSIDFKYQFKINNKEYYYGYSKDGNGDLLYEVLYIDSQLKFEFNHRIKSFIVDNIGITGSINEIRSSILRYLSFLGIYTEADDLINYVEKMIWFDGFDTMGYFNHKVNILQDIADNHSYIIDDLCKFLNSNGVSENLQVVDNAFGKSLCFVYDNRSVQFSDIASKGTIAMVNYYYMTQVVKDCTFLFMDEFDSNYHFELSDNIILYSKNLDHQTLMTTHNLRLMSNRFLDSDCFYIIDNRGVNSIDTLTDRNLNIPFNLAKLYAGGEFNE